MYGCPTWSRNSPVRFAGTAAPISGPLFERAKMELKPAKRVGYGHPVLAPKPTGSKAAPASWKSWGRFHTCPPA